MLVDFPYFTRFLSLTFDSTGLSRVTSQLP